MKRTLCLVIMLLTVAVSYAKKEYIQFCTPASDKLFHFSGELPEPLKEKIKDEKGGISKKDMEDLLGRKLDLYFHTSYVAYILNYLANYGYELQQTFFFSSDGTFEYILVRDTEKKKE